MNRTYRQLAIAAGGALLAAVASNALRRATSHRAANIAQTMTVTLSKDEVLNAFFEDPALLLRALDCTHDVDYSLGGDRRVLHWKDERHPERSGRLALIDAPGDRGTELHLFMRGEKYEVKDILRRLKAQLETGEIPTGRRN